MKKTIGWMILAAVSLGTALPAVASDWDDYGRHEDRPVYRQEYRHEDIRYRDSHARDRGERNGYAQNSRTTYTRSDGRVR